MERVFICVCLLMISTSVRCASEDIEDLLNQIFSDPAPSTDLDTAPECSGVDRALGGCSECYPCNHTLIDTFHKRGVKIERLVLKNSVCDSTSVCCVPQVALIATRSGGDCGAKRKIWRNRPTARTALEGEYPWIAVVYRKSTNQPICGATYIDANTAALLTAKSCVSNVPASDLAVSFNIPPGKTKFDVNRVVVHEGDIVNHQNDVALLFLWPTVSLPPSVAPACLPDTKVEPGSACKAIADNSYIINTIITKGCAKGLSGKGLTCTSSLPGDYGPRKGAGLICESNLEAIPRNSIYGVALHGSKDGIHTYTNLVQYEDWIGKNLR